MPVLRDQTTDGDGKPQNQTVTGGLIEKPIIQDGEVQKSVSSLQQASDIVNTLITANNYRHTINSRIRSKFDAERPYDRSKLEQEGLGWRSNFTTKPLSQIVEKIYPKYTQALEGVKYLTDSSLPQEIPNAAMKSEMFQKGITDLIRSHPLWDTLVDDISLDDVLFGHTAVAWLDEFSWFPDHFKQDELFLTDGCKQDVESAQLVCFKETYLPHELYGYIKDRETAEALGWDIKSTIEALNGASSQQLQSQLGPSNNIELWYQNAERDLTVGSSYIAGSSVIACYTLLVQETSGKVSMFRLSRNDQNGDTMKEIYGKYDRFDSMRECSAFFAFQKGNGHMHGSKGVGREVYELAAMQDRTRNEVVDRAIMSGKLFLRGDPRQLHRFKMSVIGAMCIIPNGWDVLEKSIDGKIEPFLKLDAYFGALVDQLVGSVTPRQFTGERVTKAEVDVVTAREEDMADTKVSRFMRQSVKMIATMQRRICSKDVDDEKAKAFRKQMIDNYMTEEEFEMLAEAPVARTVADLTPLERQATVAFVNEKRGHPLYNQRVLEARDITARLGAGEVDQLLLPENDPTQEAEQIRLQRMELVILAQGHEMPVSRRDAHPIHLAVCIPEVEQIAAQVQNGSLPTEALEFVANHIQEHVQRATEDGVQAPEIAQAQTLLEQLMPVIQELKKVDQQAQQLTDPAAVQPEGAPPQV